MATDATAPRKSAPTENSAQIPFDRMKEQVEKEFFSPGDKGSGVELAPPVVSFEKGGTRISLTLPAITQGMLIDAMALMKRHLEHVRFHSFDEGYYSFQAMNRNLFNTENILDNFKAEFFVLSSSARIELSKKGNLSQEEVTLTVELFKLMSRQSRLDPATRLRNLGASLVTGADGIDWDYIAGYEEVKRKIRESIILPLKNPAVYDAVARMTRKVFESNRPRAILFDGAPGVGKTTAARIIAGEANVPLIYVPVESIMSKWYGQSSQNLAQIFDASEDLGGAIIFLDEIDSLAGSRDQNMFEATRSVLSVLLRRIDGIDSAASTITIGATNRREDLDHALISRFDQIITFPMPNAAERGAIIGNYARHLGPAECAVLGEKAEGLSGRNIKDFCEFTERRWARKLLVKKMDPAPPPAEYYTQSLRLIKSGA